MFANEVGALFAERLQMGEGKIGRKEKADFMIDFLTDLFCLM